MKPWVIVGAGSIADVVATYLTEQSGPTALAAFAVDRAYKTGDRHLDRDVVCLDEIKHAFPPSDYDAFVGLGYHALNKTRLDRIQLLQDLGYSLPALIAPTAYIATNAKISANVMVLDGASVEPLACLGLGTFVWSNAVVGHHTRVGEAVWITANVTLGGNAVIGDRAFLGLGATIGNQVTLGTDCLVGAATLVTKSAPAGSVFARTDTAKHRLNSSQFLKIARLS